MKMKDLLSAAHAAGYVMAPPEEQFHAPDGGVTRVYAAPELAVRELALRAGVPALPSPHAAHEPHSWLKNMIGSVLPRRATA